MHTSFLAKSEQPLESLYLYIYNLRAIICMNEAKWEMKFFDPPS